MFCTSCWVLCGLRNGVPRGPVSVRFSRLQRSASQKNSQAHSGRRLAKEAESFESADCQERCKDFAAWLCLGVRTPWRRVATALTASGSSGYIVAGKGGIVPMFQLHPAWVPASMKHHSALQRPRPVPIPNLHEPSAACPYPLIHVDWSFGLFAGCFWNLLEGGMGLGGMAGSDSRQKRHVWIWADGEIWGQLQFLLDWNLGSISLAPLRRLTSRICVPSIAELGHCVAALWRFALRHLSRSRNLSPVQRLRCLGTRVWHGGWSYGFAVARDANNFAMQFVSSLCVHGSHEYGVCPWCALMRHRFAAAGMSCASEAPQRELHGGEPWSLLENHTPQAQQRRYEKRLYMFLTRPHAHPKEVIDI